LFDVKPMKLKFSKGEVDRAANTWRASAANDWLGADIAEANRALDVIDHFRACHGYPLQKATMGLRSSVATEGIHPVRVTQRHKRFTTILDKLAREPNMKLSRMQDIGGCRAVLPDVVAVERLRHRLERRSGFVKTYDYLTEPKRSGYRGIHVILAYDERLIEVQLRTQRMHDWAITVERLSGRLNLDLKSSKGPPELLDFLETVATIDHMLETGIPVTDELRSAADAARAKALELIRNLEVTKWPSN
jgi:putative GTP pyrophosphokinase